MNEKKQFNEFNEEEEEGKSFSIADIYNIVVLNWYWILLSVAIFSIGANIYLRYTPPVYTTSAKILIKDDNSNSGRGANSRVQTSLEMGVITNSYGFENEMEILHSSFIAARVVKKLKLYVSYRMEGNIRDQEQYRNSPILVDMMEDDLENLKSSFQLTVSAEGKNTKVEYALPGGDPKNPNIKSRTFANLPATMDTEFGTIILQRNPNNTYFSPKKKLYVSFSPIMSVARGYASKVNVIASKSRSTVITLSMTETQPGRSIDYLDELVRSYNEDANEDKNEVARKTEEFIADRIRVIQNELDSTEADLEVYKVSHELINLANDATTSLTGRTQYEREQINMQTQLTLLNSLIEYCSNPMNKMQVIPSNLGLSNAQLNQLIAQYNETVLKRNRMLKTSSETNPLIQTLTEDLNDLWPSITVSLNSIYKDMLIQKNTIDNQYGHFKGKISNTPAQERVLNNIGRQQEIKAGLYLMLLQKREENFITLASSAAKARVIESPQCQGQIAPKPDSIKMGAMGAGVVLPIAIIYLLGFLRYRIEGRDEVERLTSLPILADIPLSRKATTTKQSVVVSENSNNTMEETFRGLRTNLKFILANDEKVIISTSCIPGEGKTFISTNLAMSLALLGKRTIIVGLDIRKPRLVKLFGLPSDKRGISGLLSMAPEEMTKELIDQQIHKGIKNANLDVLPAGVIPPNPGELISRQTLDAIFAHLRDMYDFIVVDTPPVGLVSDTLELGRIADMAIFVVRADYSIKANFKLINSISSTHKLPKVNLVLNGVDLKKRKYGYYYGYGKYSRYSKYGRYGYSKYSKYNHYGHYGMHGNYKQKIHIEK